jgi:protein TonB
VAVPITTSAPTLAAAKVSQSTQAQLISSVQPKYPEMARTMHAGGDVVMSAVIGKDGVVKSVKVISGHALLRDAASNAVKQWRYKPATLDGQPVEATTQVTVKFGQQ